MSAPQLPHVPLDGEWFRPDTVYSVWSIARCASQSSSAPSQYSQETARFSLESAKFSILSEAVSRDHGLHQPTLPAVEHYPHKISEEPANTQSMSSVPVATPGNHFLGFCRGAWNLQNGDQKGSMKRCSEANAWSRSAAKKPGHAQYLRCREPKCDFRSNFVASNPFLIWNKVFTLEESGMKLRWPFLAKSHVPQRVVINSKYSFQCLFCVYLGWSEASTVYTRMELYLDHISKEHRSKPLGDVIEYKTRCVSNRVADDKELFDINLWPQTDHEARESSRWLSDDLLRQPGSISTLPNVKLEVQGNIRIPPDNLYDHHASTGLQDVLTAKEYLAEILETPALKNQANGGPTPQSESYPEGHGSTTTSSAPPAHAIALSTHSIPPHALLTPARQMQSKDSIEGQGASNDLRTGINGCLDTIVHLFREASTIIETIKDDPAIAHTPIILLLAESVKEAPSEIEKEKNRGTLRFGEAFQYGDYTAIYSLQQVATQLRTGSLDLLKAYDFTRPMDIAQLVDAADSARYTTIAALHNLKQRLVYSGCGTYQQPVPQAHPAYQSSRHSTGVGISPPNLALSGIPLQEQRYRVCGSEGSRVEEETVFSDGQTHVHFRDEDSTLQKINRRSSLLGFWKHGRMKSSTALLVDSKEKSDEIAERRLRDALVLQRRKQIKRGIAEPV